MSDLSLTIILHNAEQAAHVIRHAAAPKCREIWATGQVVEATFRTHEDAKTDRQRAYYHGVVLKIIAAQARPNGQQYPLAVWKEHFRAEYLGHKTVTSKNPLTGKKVRRRVRVSTEDLGVKGYSQLIDRVSAFAATELGVTFPATYQQWEGMQVDPDTGEIIGGVQP
ncbi:MAG: hypothetical protein QE485_10660 [Acidovorax sp.]|uniref:hypothetical protein n=1 Tax=Acidovorax sp. TaxID=1872122 RepID=UPI0026172F69|nr:hypothetical protein [Acidovorax sp.]MDH4417676.1 hypothetical protein [Acidovorax sp.]